MIDNRMDNQGPDSKLPLYDYQRLKSDHNVQDQQAAVLACGLCWNITNTPLIITQQLHNDECYTFFIIFISNFNRDQLELKKMEDHGSTTTMRLDTDGTMAVIK